MAGADTNEITSMPMTLRGRLMHDEPMSAHTSWRVGGKARRFYQPHDCDDLADFLRQLPEDEPVYWVGLGSNLLVRDGGIDGTVLCTNGVLNGIELQDSNTVRVEAGVACAKVARFCARHDLTGAEFMVGIPGTLGGALHMNAGAFGGETWTLVKEVETINHHGQRFVRKPEEFRIAYREVHGREGEWFVAAHLMLLPGDGKQSSARIRELLERRTLTQPTGVPSGGSTFRNPPGDYAGRLIEASGLKGFCIGGACVSDKHANFIINTGAASAADIEALIHYIADKVEQIQGIRLQPEVHIIGVNQSLADVSRVVDTRSNPETRRHGKTTAGSSYHRLIGSAGEFGKVAVLMGGWSAEREVSLKSGKAVHAALMRLGIDTALIDAGADVLPRLAQGKYDRVFLALHGRGGEDGQIQGALDILGIPYTGSGVLGSALSMDKLRTKQVWLGAGLPTPPCSLLDQDSNPEDFARTIGLPMAVKPVDEGSSLGVTKVKHAGDIHAAWQVASKLDDRVMAERWVTGQEYTAAILSGQALPLIRIETPREFYDYTAKYTADDTRFICPCGLDKKQEEPLQALALEAFNALGCEGWGRIDFICDKDGRPWLIEANTIPGMTDHSLVPLAARTAGIDFDELVWRILETSAVARVKAVNG